MSGNSRNLFPLDFITKSLDAFPFCAMPAIRPTLVTFLNSLTQIVFGEEYQSWRISSCVVR
jgi:hypothetical protein